MKKDRQHVTGSYIWSYHSETPSERKLCAAMRKAGLKFGQEVPVKGFTVDFLVDQWLVVEVDGESHLVSGHAEKDASRQKAIEDAGFTVMRVPAGDLSSEGGLRRWVKQIAEKATSGPPYLNQGRSSNQDYLRQIEEARKALRIGEAERKKREALAFGDSGREGLPGNGRSGGRKSSGSGESMEDYFGEKAEDFAALLEGYEWAKASDKDTGRGSGKDSGKDEVRSGRRRPQSGRKSGPSSHKDGSRRH